jgi:hypothetical protein
MKHIIPTNTFIIMKSLIVYPALLMLMAACGGKTAETKKPVTDNVDRKSTRLNSSH